MENNIYVKGHTLSEKTMRIAVPVINISIYLNPTLSFLIKPAIVIIAIGIEKIEIGNIILHIYNILYIKKIKFVYYCIIYRNCI